MNQLLNRPAIRVLLTGLVAIVVLTFAHDALAAAATATAKLGSAGPCQAITATGGPDKFERALKGGWAVALLLVFGWGVLTSLTPCVYPMIPIVLSIFGAKGKDVKRGRGALLAATYVGGMALMYTTLGVIFALTGRQTEFGAFLGNPWVVVPLVLFYAALAGSMFGFYHFDLPLSLRNRLAQVGGKGFGGAFAMGCVGGLTAAPCTGPSLLSLLAFVARTGDPLLGVVVLGTFALGMGLLFFVVGTFAVSLPKSGAWMDGVKAVGGIALLVMAIYFLMPVVPAIKRLGRPELWFGIAGLVTAAAGVALGAIHLSFHDGRAKQLRKGLGLVLSVVGTMALILYIQAPTRRIAWVHEAEGRELAAKTKRPMVVDFAARWCGPCREFETDTFADADVWNKMQGFVNVKVDATKATAEVKSLKKKYGAETLPAVVVYDSEGREVGRAMTYMGPGDFLALLKRATDCDKPQVASASAR